MVGRCIHDEHWVSGKEAASKPAPRPLENYMALVLKLCGFTNAVNWPNR